MLTYLTYEYHFFFFQTYSMLLELGGGVAGSVKYPYELSNLPRLAQLTMDVYPHLMHHIKTRLRGGDKLHQDNGALKKRKPIFQRVIDELEASASSLGGYRCELTVRGYLTFEEAITIGNCVLPTTGLPTGTSVHCRIPVTQYLAQLRATFVDAEHKGLFTGRDRSELMLDKNELLARLYNAFGFGALPTVYTSHSSEDGRNKKHQIETATEAAE